LFFFLQGKILFSSPELVADPGLSSANMSVVHVEVIEFVLAIRDELN
jgi:hypothetical protein